jgi:hypothetical protein
MNDLIGEVSAHTYGDPPLVLRRQPAARTRVRTADEAGNRRSSTEGALALSQQAVEQALSADGFLGFNIARCDSLRIFSQATAAGDSSDVNTTIDYIRDALREHGYCSLTSSGTEKMKVFVEPNEQQTGDPAMEIDSAVFVETARQITAQTASQIQEQPETASQTQARVPGGVAVKLLL